MGGAALSTRWDGGGSGGGEPAQLTPTAGGIISTGPLPCRQQHTVHTVLPKPAEFGECSPHLMWEMYRRSRGFRITQCDPSFVHDMLNPLKSARLCAIGFGPSQRRQNKMRPCPHPSSTPVLAQQEQRSVQTGQGGLAHRTGGESWN